VIPDVHGYYRALGVALPAAQSGSLNVAVACPFNPDAHRHSDRNKSATVSLTAGGFRCFACGSEGSAKDAAELAGKTKDEAVSLLKGYGLMDADAPRGTRATACPPKPRAAVDEAQIARYCAALLSSNAAVARLGELRGWTRPALERLEVGFDAADRDRPIIFPARNAPGELTGLVHYQPDPERQRSLNGPKSLAVKDGSRELFPPPESIDGDEVWVLEGEADALAAHSLDLPATAIVGVGTWRDDWAQRFAGRRRVVVCLDSDDEGRKAAGRVCKALAGVVADVRRVDLDPSRSDGFDMGELLTGALAEGRTHADMAKQLRESAEATEPFRPAQTELPAGSGERIIVAESFATIRAERTRWLWAGRIPLGSPTLLVGREKTGKSTLTCELAARLSRGDLTGDFEGEPADTLIVSYEDSAGSTIKPRLLAANADVPRVHRLRAEYQGSLDLVSLPEDVERIAQLACQCGARLLIVDPFSAALGAGTDSHRDQDMRRAIAPLAQLAEDADLAVLLLAHFNKSQGGDSLSRVLGSRGLTAAVRSVLAFGKAPDADEGSLDRVLAHAACNLAREAPSLSCRVEPRTVEDEVGIIETSRLVIGEACEMDADALLATRSDDERTDREIAAEWLADKLAAGEWQRADEIKASAKAEGIAERTLHRARKWLGVEDRREGFPAVSEWRLAVVPRPLAQPPGTTAWHNCRDSSTGPDIGGSGSQLCQGSEGGTTGRKAPQIEPPAPLVHEAISEHIPAPLPSPVCGHPTHAESWQPHPITGRLVCEICHPPAAELRAITGSAA